MYYKDLTLYKYGHRYPDSLNIGWLEKGHEFPTGNFPEKEEVLKILKSMEILNMYKGWHSCDYCNPYEKTKDGRTLIIKDRNGNGEYHVSLNGQKYQAPILIVHYIESHNYKPPQEFIDAVLNSK